VWCVRSVLYDKLNCSNCPSSAHHVNVDIAVPASPTQIEHPSAYRLVRFLRLCFVAVVTLVPSVTGGCPGGWHEYQARCFHTECTRLNWNAAQRNCGAHGGHLAVVNSSSISTRVRALVQLGVGATGSTGPYWIGVHEQRVVENDW
jgi:hypothetical protein